MSDVGAESASQALAGVRVVDLTSVLFGPLATMLLGDLGADVIKLETPGLTPGQGGDMFRHAGKPARTAGMGPLFHHYNRNKRSVSADLATEAGKELLTRLLETADVFVSNVRMPGLAKLGFDYAAVARIKPDIIYVHCSGYGSNGPYANTQAYDDLIQAAAGATDLLGRVDGDPAPRYLPSLVADKTSGLFAAFAITAALFHRARSGQGQFVEVPMFECFTHFNMTENLYGATFIPPTGPIGYSRVFNPNRKPFKTQDGYLAILPYSDAQWDDFFELGGFPGLFTKDPRYASHAARTERVAEIYARIEEVAATKTTDEWVRLLTARNVPCMRVRRLDDVVNDPHLVATDFFERREHPSEGTYLSPRHPVMFARTPASVRFDAPQLGEHTEDVRAELGLCPDAPAARGP
jgi:crotonobetainyl-CoA:carnitine CoA-transferase CaiB-like acyl-CoA transferase